MLATREGRQEVKGDTHYLAERVDTAPIVVIGVHHLPNMAVCLFSHSAEFLKSPLPLWQPVFTD